MAEFNFYLKNPKATGKTSVVLSIAAQNERTKYYTGRSINPKNWDFNPESKTYQRAIRSSTFKEAPEFNTALDSILIEAKKLANRMSSEMQREPAAWEIKNELESKLRPEIAKPIPVVDLFTFWNDTAEDIIHRTNSKTKKPVSGHMRISLLQTLKVIKGYAAKNRKLLNWENIDLVFYDSFKKYLETKLVYSGNTVGKHISNLKYIMGEANSHGIKTNLDYKNKKFQGLKEPTNAIYLTESELNQMEALDLSKRPALARVRDLFLIGCWSGLRFGDLSQLDRANIDADYIEIETKKTRKTVAVPIIPPLDRVLSKYKTTDGYSLPESLTNQKMNEALKDIAKMLPSLHTEFSIERTKGGLYVSTKFQKWQLVTTHTARRSFATNMYLNDFPVKLIMDITGHTTDRQFYQYIKMTPKQSAVKLRELWMEKKDSMLKVAK